MSERVVIWRCSECERRGWRDPEEPRGTCDKCLAHTEYEMEATLTGVGETWAEPVHGVES